MLAFVMFPIRLAPRQLLAVCSAALLCSACGITSATAPTAPAVMATEVRTNIAAPSATPTATPTHTPPSTATPTASPTATPTATLTASPWPTPDAAARKRIVRVPILMYHRVEPLPAKSGLLRAGLTVIPQDLQIQMDWLRERGFESISLYDMQNHLALGQPLPDKPIVISFDDGYRGVYDFAYPVMRAHGYTGTLFVPTELIDKQQPDYINWQMAEELARAGWKIEPHTKSHVELPGQPHKYILYQVLGSMETIRAHVGYQPRYFCYPGGEYDAEVIGLLKEIGYWGAVTTRFAIDHQLKDAYKWGRVRVTGQETLRDFALYLAEPLPTASPTPAS